MMKTAITRRRALATTGAVVAGGAALGLTASEGVSASVSTNALNIPDAEHSGKDGTVADITLNVTGSFSFSTNAAATYMLTLQVASGPDGNDYQTIDTMQDSALAASTGGQFDLGGSIMQHSNLDANGFSADPATATERDIGVKVVLEVMDSAGKILTNATAETVATVTVENTKVAVSSEVSGDGSLTVEV